MAYIRATETLGPPIEPVTLSEAKAYLSVSTADDDVLIANCIAGARAACEEYAHISIGVRQFDMYLDAWPCEEIKLPWGLVRSIEHVKYAALPDPEADPDASMVAWGGGNFGSGDTGPIEVEAHKSQYILRKSVQPSRLINVSVPDPVVPVEGIWIRYKAGFSETTEAIPITLKFAVLQMAAHLYRNREAVVVGETVTSAVELPMAARATLDAYKMHWTAA